MSCWGGGLAPVSSGENLFSAFFPAVTLVLLFPSSLEIICSLPGEPGGSQISWALPRGGSAGAWSPGWAGVYAKCLRVSMHSASGVFGVRHEDMIKDFVVWDNWSSA